MTIGLILVGISTYVGWQLTHPKRKIVDEFPEPYGLQKQDITFPSQSQDVALDGWFSNRLPHRLES